MASSIIGVVSQLISLLLMMMAGVISAKTGIITPEFRKKLSSLTINVASPCIIISSLLSSNVGGKGMLQSFLVAVLYVFIGMAGAALLVRVLRVPAWERGVGQLCLMFTNQAFMGIPVILAIYGPEGVAFLSMFILTFNLSFFSYGVMLLSGESKFEPKNLLNSGIIACLLAVFFTLTGLTLPGPVETAVSGIGNITTPMAMIIIGASLAHSDLKKAFSQFSVYKLAFAKLIIMPIITLGVIYGVTRFVDVNPVLAGLAVLLSGMPTATNCGMLSDMYTPDSTMAANVVIISTLLCMVTLPFLGAVLLVVFQ